MAYENKTYDWINYTKTMTGNIADDIYDSSTIWYGEAPTYEILDPDLTPWQPLEDWNDYVGIAEAMKAIELGLDQEVGT